MEFLIITGIFLFHVPTSREFVLDLNKQNNLEGKKIKTSRGLYTIHEQYVMETLDDVMEWNLN